MPHPKRKNSKQRKGKRRGGSTHQLKLPQLSSCPQCAEPYVPHRVCPACGYYNGRQVVSVEALA